MYFVVLIGGTVLLRVLYHNYCQNRNVEMVRVRHEFMERQSMEYENSKHTVLQFAGRHGSSAAVAAIKKFV